MATALRNRSPADIARAELDAFLELNQTKSLLRFITCGSVDDGKSTLIGRLLYDSKMLFEDQLAVLDSDSRKVGTQGDGLDFALLVDGLSAEREQGITIDVAYRFFATDKRKFIVADTPGHEQYTRNMVTGASTADLAVILIDARKGVLTQTRRHSYLVKLIGIRHVVLAINKMDLVGHDEAVFDRIVADYAGFAREAGIESFTPIPLSGLRGDNVTSRSDAMAWYDGPSLLGHLEQVPLLGSSTGEESFRMAVQWVNRPDQDFRGYAGTIAAGGIRVGDPVSVLPAGRRSTIERIVTFDGDLKEAFAGQSVTLTLADALDCSRGDIIASADAPSDPAGLLNATLVWMSDEPLVPHRSYWLKVGTQTLSASIGNVGPVVDVNTLKQMRRPTLSLNDIGEVEIDLDRSIAAVPYTESRQLGGFILIDKVTHETVAAGLVRGARRANRRPAEEQGGIVWVSGAGRAAYARCAHERLKALGRTSFVLDEAAMRAMGTGVSVVRETAKLLSAAGVHVFVTIEAPAAEAYPGKQINADQAEQDLAEDWVI